MDEHLSVQDAVKADLQALRDEGSIRPNTSGIQAAILELARTLDSREAEPRDKAAALKEIRAAMEQVATKTAGKEFTSWLDRVRNA